jgi:hypothetical protein
MSHHDVVTQRVVVAPGTLNVMIVSASDDIRLRADREINTVDA